MRSQLWRALAAAVIVVAGWSTAHAAGESRPPLPVAAAAQAEGDLPAALRDLLGDYAQRLPDVRRLEWRPPNAPPGSVATETWSPALDRLNAKCSEQADACKQLLLAQIDALANGLRTKGNQEPTEWTASLVSAAADFCARVRDVGRCGLSNLYDTAAAAWSVLGRDALFVAYLQRFDTARDLFMRPMQAKGEPIPAYLKNAFPETTPWTNARRWEALGQLGFARPLWLMAMTQAQGPDKAQTQRFAVVQVARVSWRLNDEETARGVEDMLASLPGSKDKAVGCQERHEQWRLDIARAWSKGEPLAAPLDSLRGLIRDNCAFSRALQEYVSDVLIAGPTRMAPAELRTLLDTGIAACRSNCVSQRLQALEQLRALAGEDPVARRAVLAAQKLDLDRDGWDVSSGVRLEEDLQLAWAAAATALRTDRSAADAGALLDALVNRVQLHAEGEQSASAETLVNLARYDGLYRLGAVSAAARNQPIDVRTLEGMRGQRLLRRLRQSALERRLADVRDPAAEAALRQTSAQIAEARTNLHGLAAVKEDGAWVLGVMDRLLDDTMEVARMQYLEALASRKLDGDDPDKKLRRAYTRTGAVFELETYRSGLLGRANPLDSLAPDEAYVSWLRVPGGFIAATASYDVDYYPPYPRDPNLRGGHRRRDLFIPLSPAQEATVSLYRELLLTGGAAKRGATLAQDTMVRDASGLRLRGVPVWHLRDGTFVAADKAPVGATRAQELREIGRAIFGWLLEPVRADWQGAKRLVLSPDGVLTLLPFETLWAPDRPLLDLVDVSYVQTLEVHAELKRRAEQRRNDGQRALSIAAPDFTGTTASTGSRDWRTAVQWQPLPGTLDESKALQAVFPGMRQLVGKDARRASVLQLNTTQQLKDFSVLHFATHGYVDDQRSALVLSMADGVQQAYLVDSDVAGLDLRSELVILSACDTGVGRQQRGEGVVGLPYAFMLAGNINTLMSLWPVDDAGTAAFMPVFLKKAREGKDVVTALNETKREFAAGHHGERNRDPRIWAAFVQYGVPLKL